MPGEAGFRLIVRRGPQPNQIYELTKDVLTIGRDITNDIVVSDPEVSRHHVRLSKVGDSYTAEDLGSTNGTFINNQRITGAQALANGDLLSVGETVTLAYEAVGVPAGQVAATVVGQGAQPAPPRPAAAPPSPAQAGAYEEPEPKVSRNLIIGCVVVAVVVLCLVVAVPLLFFPSDFWCQVPVANEIPVLCLP